MRRRWRWFLLLLGGALGLLSCAPMPTQPGETQPYALLVFPEAIRLVALDTQTIDPRVRVRAIRVAPGHPDGPDPHPWVDSLGVECDEADRLGEYQERIRLGLARLCGHGGTAEEPECPAQQQEEPTPSSSHGAHSVCLCRRGQQRDTCGTVSRL